MRVRRLKAGSWRACVVVVLVVLAGRALPGQTPSGTITGRVTNAASGAAIGGASLQICDLVCTSLTANASGVYTITLPVGSYRLASSVDGFVNEVFDDIPCLSACASVLSSGTRITVTNGTSVTADIALTPEGRVAGTVVDAVTRVPISQALVRLITVFDGTLQQKQALTDSAGVFSIGGLPAGTYRALVDESGSAPHVGQIFGGLECLGRCNANVAAESGAPIAVTAGAVTSNVHFALEPGGSIAGTVRRDGSTSGISGVRVAVATRVGSTLSEVGSALTDATGAYLITGLLAGSYVAHTQRAGFVNEVYDGGRCVAVCDYHERGSGRGIAVTTRRATSGIDFGLSSGGTVTGRITDADTGAGLSAQVTLLAVNGSDAMPSVTVASSSSGVFSASGLTSGSYVALAQASGRAAELFGGIPIVTNDVTEHLQGTRIPVTEGFTTSNIDVVLDRAVTIRGTARLAGSLMPASGELISLFRSGSQALRTVQSDSLGNYTLSDVPAGTYFVATSSARRDNQAFNGVACPGGTCTPTFVVANGAALTLSAGSSLAAIDFVLGPATGPPGPPVALQARNVAGGIEFSWNPPTQGGVPTSYVLEAGRSPGTTFTSLPIAGTSIVVPSVPPGSYFLRVRGVNAAGSGPVTNDVTLRVVAGSVALADPPAGIQPVVVDGNLALTWGAPLRGPVPTSFVLEVGTAFGKSDIAVLPVSAKLFRFSGVPPGVYFLRLRSAVGAALGAPSNDVMMVVGDVPAPPSEPLAFVSSVIGTVVTLRWSRPFFGQPTEYVLEAGSQAGSANIAVLRTGHTATTLTIPGVPPGRYFLRLRAANTVGLSPPSNEIPLVVP